MLNIFYYDLSDIMHPEYLKESIKAKNKQRRQYKYKKERARQLAQDWQEGIASRPGWSWAWCIEWSARWERIGRKYGLIREFKENGIL